MDFEEFRQCLQNWKEFLCISLVNLEDFIKEKKGFFFISQEIISGTPENSTIISEENKFDSPIWHIHGDKPPKYKSKKPKIYCTKMQQSWGIIYR